MHHRSPDELYEIVLSLPPFERLTRQLFDSTLLMLAGKYSGSRLRELEPRLVIDEASGTVVAGKGTRGLLCSSGGTIPDRGLFGMRIAGSKTKVGDLDEEFVFERKAGEIFALGAQTWRILDIGEESVVVEPAPPDPDIIPFWKGDPFFRSPELSTRALELLASLERDGQEAGAGLLEREYGLSEAAAEACSRFVASQAAAGLGRPSLPGPGRIVLEHNEDADGRKRETCRLVLHTLRGRAVNEPLGLALAAEMEESLGLPVQRIADDDLILFVAPRTESPDPAQALVSALAALAKGDRLEAMARSRLESSGIFGAQFRENAGRALLLPRGMPGNRKPLWMTRLRAKKLFTAVRGHADFPIVVETWRSCLSDLFDLEGASRLVRDLAAGRLELSSFSSRAPSPFAREALWQEINDNMYRNDELEARASSSVSDRVVDEALRSARLRPRLDPGLVDDFEARLKRLLPGWAPEDPLSLAEWARERVLIPASELPAIIESAGSGLAAALAADPGCGGRLVRITLPGASEEVLVHAERLRELSADPGSHLAEWLRREAAVSPGRILELFGLSPEALEARLGELEESGTIVVDLVLGPPAGTAIPAFGAVQDPGGRPSEAFCAAQELVIDAQNLEILLRRSRAAARVLAKARPPEDLARLAFGIQRLAPAGRPATAAAPGAPRGGALAAALEALAGAALPASLWETEILPARVPGYRREELDLFLEREAWQWFGAGKGLVSLAPALDLELYLGGRSPAGRRATSALLPEDGSRLGFWELRSRSGLSSAEAARKLWDEAWRGLVASGSFRDVREGIASGFGAELPQAATEPADSPLPFGSPRRVPRALRERWRGGAPQSGLWFSLALEASEGGDEAEDPEPDELEAIGLQAARARALASRRGLLCRSLLEREREGLRWAELFPAMRRLELAGELYSGRFFEGIEGPQFLDPAAYAAYQALDGAAAAAGPAWVNALDPAASALYAAAERQGLLPNRVPANRICVDSGRVVAASTRSYRELQLGLEKDDARLPAILGLFAAARGRDADPERRIVLERVNGDEASRSPFAEALRAAGFEADRARMALW